jgi:hypothetical protein
MAVSAESIERRFGEKILFASRKSCPNGLDMKFSGFCQQRVRVFSRFSVNRTVRCEKNDGFFRLREDYARVDGNEPERECLLPGRGGSRNNRVAKSWAEFLPGQHAKSIIRLFFSRFRYFNEYFLAGKPETIYFDWKITGESLLGRERR